MRRAAYSAVVATALGLSACRKPPEPFDAHRLEGSARLAKDDFAAAAAEYERSLQLNPAQGPEVWERAAYANLKAGHLDEAAMLLDEAAKRRSTAAERLQHYRTLAAMFLQTGQGDVAAERYLLEALKQDPTDLPSLRWLAELAARRGGAQSESAAVHPEHLATAVERYDALLALAPDDAPALVRKRLVLMKLLEHLGRRQLTFEAARAAQQHDAAAVATLDEQVKMTQARVDELKAALAVTTRHLAKVAWRAQAAPP